MSGFVICVCPLIDDKITLAKFVVDPPQVAQARNMSIGEHRHWCVNDKPLYREKTVYLKTHKTAINRPADHTGET